MLTLKGEIEESLLEKQIESVESGNQITQTISYYFEGELVRNDVHVILKTNSSQSEIGNF